MAGETTYANLETNGGRVAEVLAAKVHQILHDPTDLRNLMVFFPPDWAGSDTLHIPTVDPDIAMAAATNETTGGGSNTALTTSKFTLTPARYYAKMQPTDKVDITGGTIDLDFMANLLATNALGLTITDLLAALFSSVSASITANSGVDLDTDDVYEAQFSLNTARVPVSAEKPMSIVFWQEHYNNFQASLRSETGAVQFKEATAAQLMAKGPGFKGTWNNWDLYDTDSSPTANAGADRVTCAFGYGAFAYTLGDVRRLQRALSAATLWMLLPEMYVELDRDADNGMTTIYINSYPAVSIQETARAIQIIRDA